MAQGCAGSNSCHIVQTSDTRVFAENGHNVCFFDLVIPETIHVTCQTDRVTEETLDIHFAIGACKSANFLGASDITWTLCRTSGSVFSWDITDDSSFERAGVLF